MVGLCLPETWFDDEDWGKILLEEGFRDGYGGKTALKRYKASGEKYVVICMFSDIALTG